MERLLIECAVRSALIAAATAAVLSGIRIKNVMVCHYAWTAVVVFMLALPLWTAFGYQVPLRVLPALHQNSEETARVSDVKASVVFSQTRQGLPELPLGNTTTRRAPWQQWIEGIYMLGVAVFLLRLAAGMLGAYRIRRQAREVDGHLTSTSCSSPVTVGLLRSVTILPESWRDWEPAKLDAVMTHENAHARRHDPFVQWLALVNRAVFWFHPLAWWLERRIAALSEEACDIAVLERGHDAGDYSGYLLDLARLVIESRHRVRVLGMAMPGRHLPLRIQKMLKGNQTPKVSGLRMATAGAAFLLLSFGLGTGTLAHGRFTLAAPKAMTTQPAATVVGIPTETAVTKQEEVRPAAQVATRPAAVRVPKFEVASVKPCAPQDGAGRAAPGGRGGAGGRGVITSPGRLFVNCMSVSEMINIFINNSPDDRLINDSSAPLDRKRVRNGPAWIYSDRYTIDAETSDHAAGDPENQPDQRRLLMGPMLGRLLEDRFQLKAHQATEELPMYSLTVAKGGLKIRPMEEGACIRRDLSKGVLVSELFPPGEKPLCLTHLGWEGSDWKLDSAGQPLSNMAGWLSTVTGRHVFDKTGINDLFILHLTFAHDDTTPGEFPEGAPSPFAQADVPTGPSIFTVLEQQLGLKLVPDKGPHGYLIVDHVERPSEN